MRCVKTVLMALVLCVAGSCGGGSSVPVLLGPYLQDFETSPDDGFAVVLVPRALGNGATITSVTGGMMYDFMSTDGWGLGGCNAVASSGVFLMGAEQDSTAVPVVVEITFDPPVARVSLAVADQGGELVSFEARDAASGFLDGDDLIVGACPIALTTLTVDTGSENLIASVRLFGVVIVWDDLQIWRWSN